MGRRQQLLLRRRIASFNRQPAASASLITYPFPLPVFCFPKTFETLGRWNVSCVKASRSNLGKK